MSLNKKSLLGITAAFATSAALAGGGSEARATTADTAAPKTPAAAAATPRSKTAETSIWTETTGYRLSAQTLEKLIQAETNLAASKESDINLLKAILMHPNEEARSDWLRRLTSRPTSSEALRSAGISAREYLVGSGALVRAYTHYQEAKSGKPIPKEIATLVPPENLDFVESHLDRIASWEKAGGASAVKPNTLEDIYSPPPDAPPVQPAAPTKDDAAKKNPA
jgi:hypothetical protein